MVNEDYFDDFNKRRPRRSTYRGSYRRPGSSQFFDPSADILAGIESVEKTIGERKKTVKDFENAAAIRRQEMIQSLQDTESMDDMSAVDSLQSSLMQQVDDLYKLDIKSFEGNRSAYLKKANEVNRIVQTIPALMGLIDAEATALDEAKTSGKPLDKSVLRSNNPDYYNFVENAGKGGRDISFRIQNGNIIAQLGGKDIFNGNAYVKAKEKGVDLINYAKDYTKQMDEFDARASKGLKGLVKASKIEQALANGTVVETNEKNDYIDAVKAYEKALLEDPNIGALVNESTYQTFGEDDSIYRGEANQIEATKNKIVEYMVNRKFPMYKRDLGTAIADEKTTRDIGAPMSLGEKARLDFQKMKFTVDQIQTAKTEQELQRSIDFYLNRNLEHAARVSKMPKNSKQRADETVKLLNEARGIEKLGFKALQGLVNESGEFEENSESGKYYVLDADGALVQGVSDNIGLVDALNQETVYRNLNMDTRSEIKPYVTNRMANFSKQVNAIENKQPAAVNEKVKGEDVTIPTDPSEQVNYVIKLQDDKINNITLSDYNKYRNKIGLKSINQNEFDITHKPGLIEQYRLGGNEGDYGNIIQTISNEIDNYVNKNAGKKDPKSIL